MQQQTFRRPAGNVAFLIILGVVYLGFVMLFMWQTTEFVSWLFPDVQGIYRIIAVVTFDGMAIAWAVIDTFYFFSSKGMKTLVQWGWGVSFVASLVASVFYMMLQVASRLSEQPDLNWMYVGDGLVIGMTVLQILLITFFLRGEYFSRFTTEIVIPSTHVAAVPSIAPALPAPTPAPQNQQQPAYPRTSQAERDEKEQEQERIREMLREENKRIRAEVEEEFRRKQEQEEERRKQQEQAQSPTQSVAWTPEQFAAALQVLNIAPPIGPTDAQYIAKTLQEANIVPPGNGQGASADMQAPSPDGGVEYAVHPQPHPARPQETEEIPAVPFEASLPSSPQGAANGTGKKTRGR